MVSATGIFREVVETVTPLGAVPADLADPARVAAAVAVPPAWDRVVEGHSVAVEEGGVAAGVDRRPGSVRRLSKGALI